MSRPATVREPGTEPAPAAARGRAEAVRANLLTLLPYFIAGAIFVGLGLLTPRFMLNWTPGILLLLAVAWGIPTLWQRWRRK